MGACYGRCDHHVAKAGIPAQNARHEKHKGDFHHFGQLKRNAAKFQGKIGAAGFGGENPDSGQAQDAENTIQPGQIFQKLDFADNNRNQQRKHGADHHDGELFFRHLKVQSCQDDKSAA